MPTRDTLEFHETVNPLCRNAFDETAADKTKQTEGERKVRKTKNTDSSLLTKQGTRGYNREMKSTRGTRGEALNAPDEFIGDELPIYASGTSL